VSGKTLYKLLELRKLAETFRKCSQYIIELIEPQIKCIKEDIFRLFILKKYIFNKIFNIKFLTCWGLLRTILGIILGSIKSTILSEATVKISL